MILRVVKLLKVAAIVVAVAVLTLAGVRIYDTQRGPDLQLWHTFVPEEPTSAEIDEADWDGYLAHEQQVFAEVRAEVTDQLPPEVQSAANRYYAESPVYPGGFAYDWNRSYVLEPDGEPLGRRSSCMG